MNDLIEFDPDFDQNDYCPDRRDEIVTYVFDEMGPGAAEAFVAHLASCEGCRDEVSSLGETLRLVADSSALGPGRTEGLAADPLRSFMRDESSWEEEWIHLRRRLLAGEAFVPEEAPAPGRRPTGLWLAWAASVTLIASVAFSAGLWRGASMTTDGRAPATERGSDGRANPPVSGASVGNYFDNLDDFTRDTHNFLRRTRMVLMEFSNLGADTDPTFFRESGSELLAEVTRYQDVAKRVQSRKLGELLDQIAGILSEISRVDQANQKQVISDVKMTLNMTGLIATLDLLDSAGGREVKRHSNV
jgi:hypothetical protein